VPSFESGRGKLEIALELMGDLLEKQRAEGAFAPPPPALTTPRKDRAMADELLTATDCNAKGSQGELIAAAWLLGLGYHVFRNLAASGPVDIVIWHPRTGEFRLIDVKMTTPSALYRKADGSISFSVGGRQREGVHCLVVVGTTVQGFLKRGARQSEWHWPLDCPNPLIGKMLEHVGPCWDAARLRQRRSRLDPACAPSKTVEEQWR
jgi:hypothetical protein